MNKNRNKAVYAKILLVVKPEFDLPYKEIGSSSDYSKDKKFTVAFNDIQGQVPDFRMTPLFTGIPISRIRELAETAVKTDPSYQPVDFTKYFYFSSNAHSQRKWKEHINVLSDSILFEVVITEEEPKLAAPTPDYSGLQTYLGPLTATNLGIDLDTVRGEAGSDGSGINFIDIETDWNFDHEDLRDLEASLAFGTRSGIHSDIEHGTSVLGVIAANDNSSGCKGIAPNCTIRTISYLEPDGRTANIYNALIFAYSILQYGDIILLEIQTISSNAPVEIGPITQQVIRLGTALGMVIIEAAGDGTNDLDTMIAGMLNTSNTNFNDSGAIMVGGVDITTRSKLYSSQGNRINCFAPSSGVYTPSGISAAGIVNNTYHYFSGTSSASAIIAGMAVSMQGIIFNRIRWKLNSFQMRNLLGNTTTGIPSADPIDDRVGVMPNLANMIRSLNDMNVDVYIRDNFDDNGDRYMGAISTSPDIITSQSRIADPDAAFGVGSHTENRTDLGETITRDMDNYVYIRVLNRGILPAYNVQVRLFYSLPSTLVTPDRWNYIGETTLPEVPPGNILAVSPEPITWSSANIPANGHYCFIGVIGNEADPFPIPFSNNPANPLQGLELLNYNAFKDLIRNQNNITWRNFNIVELDGSTTAALPFHLATPAIRTAHTFHINGILPKGTTVRFMLNEKLAKLFKSKAIALDSGSKSSSHYVEWANTSSNIFRNIALKNIKLPKNIFEKCTLSITLPKKIPRQYEYRISISQYIDNVMAGKITWLLRDGK